MLDVLLVVHRVVGLRYDVLSLCARPPRSIAEAMPTAVRSPGVAATSKSTSESQLDDDDSTRLKTESRECGRERPAGSQSRCSSWSRDRSTCSKGEVVELTQWFVVVVVCAGCSVFMLLPVAAVGAPTHAMLPLSRVLPSTTIGSTDHPADVDDQRSSADVERQHIEFKLRQLLALRQLHGTMLTCIDILIRTTKQLKKGQGQSSRSEYSNRNSSAVVYDILTKFCNPGWVITHQK